MSWQYFRKIRLIITLLILASGSAYAKPYSPIKNLLNGFVVGNGAPQAGYQVYLYASYAKGRPYKSLLGTDISDASGHFEIKYKPCLSGCLPKHLSPA